MHVVYQDIVRRVKQVCRSLLPLVGLFCGLFCLVVYQDIVRGFTSCLNFAS